MQDSTFRQLVWDYNMTPSDYQQILNGKKRLGNLDQSWAIARVLVHTDYYTARQLVSLDLLKQNWNQVKSKIFNKNIKDGYEFVLRRHALSPAG